MTSRERVLTALAHRPTDRIPRLLYEEVIGYTPAIAQLLQRHCAPQSPREYFAMDITRVELAPTRLPRSRFATWLGPAAAAALASGQVDEWGVWWQPGDFHHFRRLVSPLSTPEHLDRLEEYPWPDLDEPYRQAKLAARVAALQTAGLAVAGYAGSVFERSWYLRGMEALMMDMIETPARAHFLFEHAARYQQRVAEAFARAGADIVITGDDVAGQQHLLMRIGMWREYLKPHLAATVQAVKRVNPATRVFYHSDGNVTALIPDLIEVGIDILNPIQPECMDPRAVKREFGDRLSFWGAVSVQRTLPLGTPEAVRAEVRARIREVGAGGGFILAPAHVLGPETPWPNIVAFFAAADATTVPRA